MNEERDRPPILVGFDGTPQGHDALELGRVAARTLGGRLEVARVLEIESTWLGDEPDDARLVDLEAETTRLAARRLDGTDYEVKVRIGSPGEILHDLAEADNAAAIVLGPSHRGGVARVLFGSVAEGLLQGAPCAVAVAPPDYARRRGNTLANRIVVGFDGSEEARVAAHAAAEIAKTTGATVEVIGVMRPLQPSPARGPYLPLAREAVTEKLEAIAAELKSAPAVQTVLAEGEPAATLAERSSRADLLVVGSRGYGPIRRALLGSVSRAVIHSADCPVLVWPRPSGLVKP